MKQIFPSQSRPNVHFAEVHKFAQNDDFLCHNEVVYDVAYGDKG